MTKETQTTATNTKTVSQKIWDEIKNKKIDMFSLPDQTVTMHCSPMFIDPSTLYLTYKASSVITQLEESLGAKYKVSIDGKYISVAKV
jgi:hypothetical protein